MSNLNLGGKYLAWVGKRRWRIEAFFKTIKGRFRLERFVQHSKRASVFMRSSVVFLGRTDPYQGPARNRAALTKTGAVLPKKQGVLR